MAELAAKALGRLPDWFLYVIVVVALWFIFRSWAIRALRQSLREQNRRLTALERRVERLLGMLSHYGCSNAPTCDRRRPFDPDNCMEDGRG